MPNIISRNTTADVLRGFGIIAVVAGHAGSNIGIQVLPVYSYHMPLFFFISGMFYNDVRREKFLDIITKLCTRLVVPALISILIYNFIVLGIFHKFGLPIQSQEFGIASIIRSFTFGTLFAAACWFISTYIAVYVYFAVVNRAIFTKIVGISNGELNARVSLLFIYLMMSVFVVIFSTFLYGGIADQDRHYITDENECLIIFLRFVFGCSFYYLGFFSNIYLRKKIFSDVVLYAVILIIFTIQGFIYYNFNVYFSMQIMSFPNAFSPMVTSIIGITIFYFISSILVGSKSERIFSLIGRNSFAILLNHIFGFFILNMILVSIGLIRIADVNNIYFRYNEHYMYPLYISFGIGISMVIPVAIKSLFQKGLSDYSRL